MHEYIKLIILSLIIFLSFSFQKIRSFSFSLHQILDIKITNADTVYINHKNQYGQYKISIYNISTHKLVFTKQYNQTNNLNYSQIYIDQKNNIIGGYSQNYNNFTRFNLTNGTQMQVGIVDFGNNQKFSKLLISNVHNLSLGFTVNRKIFFSQSLQEFPYGYMHILQDFSFFTNSSLSAILSMDQKYFTVGYQQISQYNDIIARFYLYDLQNNFYLKIIYLQPGDVRLVSYCWKNDSQIIYYICDNYNQINGWKRKLCIVNVTTQTHTCVQFPTTLLNPVIQFQPSLIGLVIHSKDSAFSPNYYYSQIQRVIIQYRNITTLQIVSSRNYILQFSYTNTQFYSINDKVIYFQHNLNRIFFHTITNCSSGYYYDNCQHQCIKFHDSCMYKNQEGCNCRINQTDIPDFKNQIDKIINNTFVNEGNHMPGIKVMFTPIHSFIVSFDQFRLYNYHTTQYNTVIQNTFNMISEMGQQRWKILHLDLLWENFINNSNINLTRFSKYFNVKYNYSSINYIKYEQKSCQFYVNVQNFLFPTIIITIAAFILAKILFFLFKRLNKNIPDDFLLTGNIFILILQGNIQYLCYLIGFEIKLLFQTNFVHKLLTSSIIMFFFFCFYFVHHHI